MESTKKGKKRSQNWTTQDRQHLVASIESRSHIIESKRQSGDVLKKKNKAWEEVLAETKLHTGKTSIDMTEIKGVWKRIKLAAKSEDTRQKHAFVATGGGPKPKELSEETKNVMRAAPQEFQHPS